MKLKAAIQALVFGSGKEAPMPQSVNGRFFHIVRYHYGMLLGLNLLFLICCLPIVTIPSACCAMNRILLKLTEEKPVFFWKDFWAEFRQDFGKRLALWLPLAIAPFSLAFYAVWLGLDRDGTGTRLLCGVLVFLIQSYWFLCMALIDTSPGSNLKNAVILMAVEWKKALQVLLSAGLVYGLCLFFPLYSFPAALLCLFSGCQLMACILLKEPILAHLQSA